MKLRDMMIAAEEHFLELNLAKKMLPVLRKDKKKRFLFSLRFFVRLSQS